MTQDLGEIVRNTLQSNTFCYMSITNDPILAHFSEILAQKWHFLKFLAQNQKNGTKIRKSGTLFDQTDTTQKIKKVRKCPNHKKKTSPRFSIFFFMKISGEDTQPPLLKRTMERSSFMLNIKYFILDSYICHWCNKTPTIHTVLKYYEQYEQYEQFLTVWTVS